MHIAFALFVKLPAMLVAAFIGGCLLVSLCANYVNHISHF